MALSHFLVVQYLVLVATFSAIATKGIMTEDDPKLKTGLVLHPDELRVNPCNGGFLYGIGSHHYTG